ncbi:D-alanyl-D-alanine carboxypeptidase [Streptomyces griseoaurantiacus M045]|uniref:serine-type D-Ala-D-Ala carboxypeptidase n=1 Tax=Streptomyces griseoaurantiacus M045 TaxID=996637 RepID=F3NSG5_9ACTN|nr:D-alanyl-D-alanine carboxypeptidase [Streptomyces griseoaurantiacus]EGG43738.1 D-alanyl-D-alanine carboxypeptidase [Streptomyces griseoaurantiacus M045]
MAGESPDRSKQHESSKEPTSGSGSAVPGPARPSESGAASAPADPRLTVARERVRVDQATAVFSTRALKEAVRPSAADGGGTESAEAAEAPEGAVKPAGTGEEDRRAAVASWVRSADRESDEADESDEAGTADAAEDPASGGDGDGAAEDGPAEPADAVPARAERESGGSTSAPERKAEPEPEPDAAGSAKPAGADGTATTAEADESGKSGKNAKDDKDDKGAKDDPKPAVDQATAVFKAPRPAVDRPTATLKRRDTGSGKDATGKDATGKDATGKDGAKDTGTGTGTGTSTDEAARKDTRTTSLRRPKDSGSGSGTGTGTATSSDAPKPSDTAGSAAEREAERTSRFVPLKSFDDPEAGKPRPTPTAGRGVRTDTAKPAAPKNPESDKSPKGPEDAKAPAAPVPPAAPTAALPRVGPERTTQQPLPPKPPLDLLAELTNTPPPPETPARTLVRRVKIWTPLVVLLAIVFAVAQSMRPLPDPALDLTAQSSYAFKGSDTDIPWPSGGQAALDVLGIGSYGSSGEQKPAPIASVTKVMTAYLILKNHPLKGGEGEKIKVDQPAEDQATADGESTVKVHAGDSITEKEALQALLIASANNVARLVARWDAGSEKAFVAKMNTTAKQLGMTNTTYTDPSGLEKTTVSTAVDQVKLAKAAMKDSSFRQIAAMMEYTDYKGDKHSNWNRLVGYNGVVGIKTGTTTAAGGNLVFAAVKKVGGQTRTIVGAVVGQGPGGEDNTILSGALDASDKLIRAAQASLESATILKKGTVVGAVDDGLGGRTPVVITKDVKAVGWAGLTVKLKFAADELPHTAKAGAKVGSLTVGDGTGSAVKVPVTLRQDLEEPGFTSKLTRLG